MEKISINKSATMYNIEEIRMISAGVLKIEFESEIPDDFGDIAVYTSGDNLCAQLQGFDTVYRKDGNTVYLSNNGAVYQEPELEPEPYEPTEEELLSATVASKKAEISAECENVIYAGVNVKLSKGWEHFALTEHDQINLFAKQAQLNAGVEQLEYHADGQPCRYYSAADMQIIITAAMFHVSYHTTYCNAINMWIAGCQTAEEVQEISYGADVPEEYQSEVLKAYILQIAAEAGDMDESKTAE
jgi:hypothetical protein